MENLDAKGTHSNWDIMQWVVPLTHARINYLFILLYRSVVSSCSEDGDVDGVDKEVEVEQVLDKAVPLVLQQPVQGLHQQHLMTVLCRSKRRILVGPEYTGL